LQNQFHRYTKKNRLRVQGRELFSVGICYSVVARLRLGLLLLGSGNLCSSWETTVDWVVEERSDVVDKKGIKQLGDLFFVGEFEGTLERNPDTFQMHWANLDHMLLLLALEDAIPSTSGHASNIEELGTIDHMIILSSSNTGAFDINLEAQSSLVLPQSSGNPRLHARGRNLSRCIHIHLWLAISSLHIHCSHWR